MTVNLSSALNARLAAFDAAITAGREALSAVYALAAQSMTNAYTAASVAMGSRYAAAKAALVEAAKDHEAALEEKADELVASLDGEAIDMLDRIRREATFQAGQRIEQAAARFLTEPQMAELKEAPPVVEQPAPGFGVAELDGPLAVPEPLVMPSVPAPLTLTDPDGEVLTAIAANPPVASEVCPDCGGPTGDSSHVDGCCGPCVGKRLLALTPEEPVTAEEVEEAPVWAKDDKAVFKGALVTVFDVKGPRARICRGDGTVTWVAAKNLQRA